MLKCTTFGESILNLCSTLFLWNTLLFSAPFFCSKAHWSVQVESPPQRLASTSSVIFPLAEFSLCHCLSVYWPAGMSSGSTAATAASVIAPRNMTLTALRSPSWWTACERPHVHAEQSIWAHTHCSQSLKVQKGKKKLAKLQIEEPVPFRELTFIK